LGKLTEALDIYKEVGSLAPNYSDAHIGRLALLNKLVQERQEKRSFWVEQFLVAYELAVKADPEVGDKVDDDVRRLFKREIFQREMHRDIDRQVSAKQLPEPFQRERRRDIERQVSATQLPEPEVIDQAIYHREVLPRLIKDLYAKLEEVGEPSSLGTLHEG
jgi:hypothetical protein